MPRRKQATAEEGDVEKRVTRRSLRSQAATPKKEEEKKEEEKSAETPTKSPGRGRARPKSKKADDEDAASEEAVTPAKKGRGKGRASASPRGRKAKKADSDEDSAAEEMNETTPSKSSRRSPRASASAEETPSPRRKSSRGAAKAASEAIGKQVGDEEEGVEEEEGETARGTKRKADEEQPEETGEASEEKRQKVEAATESKEEKAEESKEAEVDQEEKKDSEVAMDTEQSKDEKAEETTEEKQETPAETEKQEIPADSEKQETPVETEEKEQEESPTPQESVSAAENVQEKSAEETPTPEVEKTPAPAAEKEEESKQEEEPMDADARPEDDYVMVAMGDVPAHDSLDVQKSLPKTDSLNNQSNTDTKQSVNSSAFEGGSLPNSSQTSNDTSVNTASNSDNPLFSRTFVMNPAIDHSTIDPSSAFTIASYNILAECHAVRGRREWEQYQFTTEECLTNSARHPKLWKEFEYLDADIYCLQEVPPSYFEDVLTPAFEAKGYKGHYIKRAHADYQEGEATFYNAKRFTAISCQGYALHELAKKGMDAIGVSEINKTAFMECATNPGVFMMSQLQCNVTKCMLSVANIHVSWEFFKRPDIQCLQIATAIKALVNQAGGADKPHVICGDFNSTPTSPGHQLARDGYLSDSNVTLLQSMDNITMPDGTKTSMINLFWKGFQHTSNNLKSSYQTVQGTDPISSCFPHDSGCRAVDYIWYSSSSLKLAGVLQTADAKLIEGGIPNHVFPSDHLSVKAKLAFA